MHSAGPCNGAECNGKMTWANGDAFRYRENLYDGFLDGPTESDCFLATLRTKEEGKRQVKVEKKGCSALGNVICMLSSEDVIRDEKDEVEKQWTHNPNEGIHCLEGKSDVTFLLEMPCTSTLSDFNVCGNIL